MPFAQALIEAGPSRVVWGSDWPHVIHDGFMPNDGELLDLLTLWAPDAALRKRMLTDYPRRGPMDSRTSRSSRRLRH